MSNYHDKNEMNKQKRGLLITMIQRKFENHVYDQLSKTDFADMDSLDKWLDGALEEYILECEAVSSYYDGKLYS